MADSFRVSIILLTFMYFVLLRSQIVSSALLLSLKNHHNHQHKTRPMFQTNRSSCALFSGAWVRDDSYPIYQYSDCPMIEPDFNCQLYGRPDSGYLRYRWAPLNCELPRFNGLQFLERMKGKSMMFVGDSLGRNQWESLICMIATTAPSTVYQMNRGDPLSTFKFLDYGLTVSYYKARYLVDIEMEGGNSVLKLDDISENGNAWRGFDVLSFNTGHWWNHQGSIQGWEYMETGGTYYEDMDRLVAMGKGLKTWANWINSNIDSTKTRLFFLNISPTHYNSMEWNAGSTSMESTKNCYGETAPMSGTAYPGEYMDQMNVVESALNDLKVPVYLLDITMLSAVRKEAHPSIYTGALTTQQRDDPQKYADCSHWCLPGLPDTWNQLFYAAMFS